MSRTARAAQVATLALGASLVLVPLAVATTRWDVLRHNHVAYPVLLAVSLVAGVALLVATLRGGRRTAARTEGGGAGESDPPRPARGWVRRTGEVIVAVLLVALVATAAWLRPFPASDDALAAFRSDASVELVETGSWYAFVPSSTSTSTASDEAESTAGAGADGGTSIGLVYSPGARVDARASARVLRPLAEAGYTVVVLKEPLGIALVDVDQSSSAIDAFGEVERWVVGGHSLGGVAAAEVAAADPRVDGLLLHASYPAGDLSADEELRVMSVSGARDGLTTPDDVEASRAQLPASAAFVEVEGAVHAFFADYGPQPGDGEPTVGREQAQREIVDASLALLDAVAGGPPAG